MAVNFATPQDELPASAGRSAAARVSPRDDSHRRSRPNFLTAWLQRRLVALLERPVRAIVAGMDRERDDRFVRALAAAPSPVICPGCKRLHAADLRNCPECGHGPALDDPDARAIGQGTNAYLDQRLDAMRREGF